MENLFPYQFRPGQRGLIEFVQERVWGEGACINAATGFGKTPAILAALLPYVLKFGYKIMWAVRTGNETDRPIEELKVIDRKFGTKFFGLSYRGKRDMCLLARERIGEEFDHADATFLCESEGEDCPYRQNFERSDPLDLAKGPMLYAEIFELCKESGICPYLTQRELLPFADVVSLSYNYIIDPKLGWSIKRAIPFNRSFLVVDEAHNLQHACSSLNSDRITIRTLDHALRELGPFGPQETLRISELILALRGGLIHAARGMREEEAEFDVRGFVERSLELQKIDLDELVERFRRMGDLGIRVRRELLRRGRLPRSSLFHLANFWLSSIEQLEIPGVAFLLDREGGLALERWDMRVTTVLRERWKEFRGCVFCSGTLNPVRAFAETVGLEAYAEKQIPSHYDPKNICSLITRGLTTRGEELSEQMALRYVGAVRDFVRSLRTNLAVFSASYRIQQGLLRAGLREAIEAEGRAFFQEVQGMSGDRGREILERFKGCARGKRPGLLCATAQGRFAEGADFPGEELEGIFLVGVPFERMSARTELYLKYYSEIYGKQRGTYYAYVIPALRRAAQSLGRALRSSEEKAVFVCGDERYAQPRFFRLLPDFIRAGVKTIDPERLSSEIRA